MSRDYARDDYPRRRGRPPNSRYQPEAAKPLWWFVMGVVLGFALAAALYIFNTAAVKRISDRIGKAVHTNSNQIKQAADAKETSSSQTKPKFDFYTILPANKIPANSEKPNKDAEKSEVLPADTVKTPKVIDEEQRISLEELEAARLGIKMVNNQAEKEKASHIKQKSINKLKEKIHTQEIIQTDVEPSETNSVKPVAEKTVTIKSNTEKSIASKPTTYIVRVVSVKNYADADALRAQLLLLGIDTKIQTVKNTAGTMYQINFGPYKNKKDALAMQNNLASNNIKSRLLASH